METNQKPMDAQQTTAERSKAYEIARTAALAAIGVGVVAVEAVTALVEKLVARGEQARSEAADHKPASGAPAPAEVDVLQNRVEQLKAELESLQSQQAPDEGMRQ